MKNGFAAKLQSLAEQHRFWVDAEAFAAGPKGMAQPLDVEVVAANPRFKSYFVVSYGDPETGQIKFRQIFSANTAAEGVKPTFAQAVVVVPLLKEGDDVYIILREGYRRCAGGWLADPVRGYALDNPLNNYSGEDVGRYLPNPEWGWQVNLPTDGVILGNSAKKELAEEVFGSATPDFLFYVDWFHENDYGHIGANVVWLAGVVGSREEILAKIAEDDPELTGGAIHFVPVGDRAAWRKLLRGHYGQLGVFNAMELFTTVNSDPTRAWSKLTSYYREIAR